MLREISHNLTSASSRSSRPIRRAKKNMATESSLYSTITFIHNGDHSKKITQQFQLLNPNLVIYSHTERSNTNYMPYILRVFSRIMNKKCLVSEPYSLKTSYTSVKFNSYFNPINSIQFLFINILNQHPNGQLQ